MGDVSFNIKKHLLTVSENQKGWTKEVNLVSWNDREVVVDIRDWAPDHEKMGKGVTVSKEAFRDILEKIKVEDLGFKE